jgi:hypothetical protein
VSERHIERKIWERAFRAHTAHCLHFRAMGHPHYQDIERVDTMAKDAAHHALDEWASVNGELS